MLLLQAPFDLNDEKPPLRLRRGPDAGAPHLPHSGGSSGAAGQARPRTQPAQVRVLLCAPATFRGQRAGTIPVPHAPRLLFVDPQGWAARRHVRVGLDRLTRSPCSARPYRMYRVAYGSSLPQAASDMSTLLLAARRHVKAYRQPTANTLAMAAGTAVVAIVTHYWHSQALPQVALSLSVEQPRLSVALPPPSLAIPHLYARLSRAAAVDRGTPSMSAADLQRLMRSLPTQSVHGDGFDLDITSPTSLWASAGVRYRIDPLLIYAVALVESKSAQADGSIAPSPWVVRINGRMHKGSRAEAERAIQLAHSMSLPVQDVGIMQVYYPVHRDLEPDPIALLNPVRNIEVGAGLLRKAMQQSRDPVLRIGYYHSHDAALARGYGEAVLSVYRGLKLAMAKASSAGAVALARAPADSLAARSGG